MKDFELIRELVGANVTENSLKNADCYVRPQLGLFIPTVGTYVNDGKINHSHPSYMIMIYFEESTDKPLHYRAEITSPEVPHNNKAGIHYYCLMIAKDYFESRYKMYSDELPSFREHSFGLCSDILKALNTFAFEYSKSMMNSDITLDAHSEIITHWIIRSIFLSLNTGSVKSEGTTRKFNNFCTDNDTVGENPDLRAISDDYSVARAQHYMEQHYAENITVSKLAELGYVSASSLNRKFKQEIGITPIDYLIEIRIERSKILLRRKSIPMTDIAMRCGFSSSAHFSSCFQNRIGMTPTEYRNKFKD